MLGKLEVSLLKFIFRHAITCIKQLFRKNNCICAKFLVTKTKRVNAPLIRSRIVQNQPNVINYGNL